MTDRFAGESVTRRVRLEADESILLKSGAVRFMPIGGEPHGVLTLTTRRLIWTPSPIFLFDMFPWQAANADVTTVSLVQRDFWRLWRWLIRIESGPHRRRFFVGNKAKANHWIEAIKQWANISE